MQHHFKCLSRWIIFSCWFVPTTPASGIEKVEGFTEPFQQIELAAGEPGVLTEVLVHEDTRVTAGQKLGQLDTSVLEETFEIAKLRSESTGALRAAEAELELREKYLAPLSQLRGRGHATQREIERAIADVKVAQARVAMAQEELALQRLECDRIKAQIRRRQLFSPIDGVVSEICRDVGEFFMANDPRVLTIVQLDRLRAKFATEPTQADRIVAGQNVQLELNMGETIEAIVETVAPIMDAKSATVEVTVLIKNPNEAIASGTRCWLIVPHHDGVTTFTSTTDLAH
ncbi:MAG: efflux transporter periplasmic adaptor subunit [Planctomycetaceae bacterium]|nr:efflux transporter periplasmic adaptor subunit [Planctomycetaceae bacterium]